MNGVQSPQVLARGDKPGWRDSGWLTRYALRGLLELARARVLFGRLTAKRIVQRNRAVQAKDRTVSPPDRESIARISYVLPRISHRLPWRSDCLVQAIAGQNWLSARGHASEIQIGVEHPEGEQFGAHAWLRCGDIIVTGGNIVRYEAILTQERLDEPFGLPEDGALYPGSPSARNEDSTATFP